MFREGKNSPEVLAEIKKQNQPKQPEAAAEIGPSDEQDLLVGVMSPDQYVKNVLKQEGGNKARVEQVARMIQEFWLRQVDERKITPEEFLKKVRESTIRMLKKGAPAEPSEKEKLHEERVRMALGR